MPAKATSLVHTDFPMYTISMIGDTHFMVAGGGGSAKTGITNAIEIYKLKDDQGTCVANQINHFDLEESAVMNSGVYPKTTDTRYHLATGQDEKCQMYLLRQKIITLTSQTQQGTGERGDKVRKRKTNFTKSQGYDNAEKSIVFELEKQKSVQTDFSKESPFQKCVHFSCDKSILVTAGADGFLRVWKYPDLEMLYEVEGHKNEIDDLDISPPGNRICTVSKDSKGFVWDTKDGGKKFELVWEEQPKYRMRSCRYAKVIDKKDEYNLYTSHIPISRSGKSQCCYLSKWGTKNYQIRKTVKTGPEVLSAMAVSSDGVYLAVGTLSGSVSVYISFSLQRLYHVKEAHGIFVTGLEFTPNTSTALAVTGGHDFTLLSISADNYVKLHQQAPRALYSPLWAIAGFVIIIYLLYWMLSVL